MTQIARLGLNKLFLWSETERFQAYPQAMARLRPGRIYTRRQVAEELMQLAFEEEKAKHLRESQTRNMFGLVQVGQEKLLIKGINLLRRMTHHGACNVSGMSVWERASDEWVPTEAALRMGEAYREAPDGVHWQQLLAEQLARYEPRTRVLLHLLSHGRALRFESPDFFSGNTQRASLTGENSYALFGQRCAAFNPLLFDHAEVALGPWWREEIEAAQFELAENFRFEGAKNQPPSTNHLNSSLKTSLFVFCRLGILVAEGDIWTIDVDAFARNLSSELGRDLLGEEYVLPPALSDEWMQLAYVVDEQADERGFIVASEAANRWGELADLQPSERVTAFDALVRRGIFEGRVEMLDRHLGQPRMGRGLFGDDDMRLIRLRVLT